MLQNSHDSLGFYEDGIFLETSVMKRWWVVGNPERDTSGLRERSWKMLWRR